MEVVKGKHVKIILDLNIGDTVQTDGWGKNLDGVDRKIEDIKEAYGKSQSGFTVKITGYDRYIDSDWLIKSK
jgi:hypothetical protein